MSSYADMFADDLRQYDQDVIDAFMFWHDRIYQRDEKTRLNNLKEWIKIFDLKTRKEAKYLIAQVII